MHAAAQEAVEEIDDIGSDDDSKSGLSKVNCAKIAELDIWRGPSVKHGDQSIKGLLQFAHIGSARTSHIAASKHLSQEVQCMYTPSAICHQT